MSTPVNPAQPKMSKTDQSSQLVEEFHVLTRVVTGDRGQVIWSSVRHRRKCPPEQQIGYPRRFNCVRTEGIEEPTSKDLSQFLKVLRSLLCQGTSRWQDAATRRVT